LRWKLRGGQERLRARSRASAMEPAALRNNSAVAGSGTLAEAPSPVDSLPESPASGLPPLGSPPLGFPPLGSGGGSFAPPFSAIGLEVSAPPAELLELPLEELLEPGVQPIRKKRAAPIETKASFCARVPDMAFLSNDLHQFIILNLVDESQVL
jgi:hypothetical protein